MLLKGDSVALVVNSNKIYNSKQINQLIDVLHQMDLKVVCSPYLYNDVSGKEKAEILHHYYLDDGIKMIFDLSGGDLANSVIDELDYNLIKEHPKMLFGYSDLTCIINAIFTMTGQINGLYQIRNLVRKDKEKQVSNFYQTMFNGKEDLYDFTYHFIQGNELSGIVVGGNMRCFLKLAGTKYFPDMKDKVLMLESYSGAEESMINYLVHLRQLNVFNDINGIILGTFSELDKVNPGYMEKIIRKFCDKPIVKTEEIGHYPDSKALLIGKNIDLRK